MVGADEMTTTRRMVEGQRVMCSYLRFHETTGKVTLILHNSHYTDVEKEINDAARDWEYFYLNNNAISDLKLKEDLKEHQMVMVVDSNRNKVARGVFIAWIGQDALVYFVDSDKVARVPLGFLYGAIGKPRVTEYLAFQAILDNEGRGLAVGEEFPFIADTLRDIGTVHPEWLKGPYSVMCTRYEEANGTLLPVVKIWPGNGDISFNSLLQSYCGNAEL